MENHIAYISLGSNMGDSLNNCQKGMAALTLSCSTGKTKLSPFYKTQPQEYSNQDWFINAVAMINTTLEPLVLFKELQSIQEKAGRIKRTIRFGPRILDLDILLYDNMVINYPQLTIPHPRMHKRRFVLQPLYDINPDIIHPVMKKNVKTLLNNIKTDEQGIRPVK